MRSFSFLIGLLFLVSISLLSTLDDSAFATNGIENISIPQGTGTPGCEATNKCFIPYEITIHAGDSVKWSNDDSAAHTVTSGSAVDGASGIFDSGLFMAGTTFSQTFEKVGEYPYFCMVHPWMEGIVDVNLPTLKITPDGSSQVVYYAIAGGVLNKITPDVDANSLIISITANKKGGINISLPRSLIDSKVGSNDNDFFVLINGEEINYEELESKSPETHRFLQILFPLNVQEIEIVGNILPEFEPKLLQNGCPVEFPYLWSDGNCENYEEPIPQYMQNGCPVEFPYLWSDGNCENYEEPIPQYMQNGCPVEFPYLWSDGNCENYEEPIPQYMQNGCPVEFPYLWLDGNCENYEESTNPPPFDPTLIIIGIVIAAVAGGAGLAISKSRKSSKPDIITSKNSDSTSSQTGKKCNVCGTFITKGENICPNCGDTYS